MTRLKVVDARELLEFASARNLIDGEAHPAVKDLLPAVEVHSPTARLQLPPMEVENRQSFVLRLPEAIVSDWLGVIYEGHLLPGGFAHLNKPVGRFQEMEAGWCEHTPGERVVIDEQGMCMLGTTFHWGHFFVDVLDRLLLLRKRGWLGRRLLTDEAPSCENAMMLARKAGIAPEESSLFRASFALDYHVRDFYLPTIEAAKPAIPAASFRELARLVAPGGDGAERGPVLFVGRDQVVHRPIVDQKGLAEYLELSGRGKVIFPEHLSIDQAIAHFSAAAAVLLPIGSAMFNLIFCRPGTPVVCIMPSGYAEQNTGVTGTIRHICHAMGLKLSLYSCGIGILNQKVPLNSSLVIGRNDVRRMLSLVGAR